MLLSSCARPLPSLVSIGLLQCQALHIFFNIVLLKSEKEFKEGKSTCQCSLKKKLSE